MSSLLVTLFWALREHNPIRVFQRASLYMFYNEDLWPNRMEVLITLDQTSYIRIDIPWHLRIDADFQWFLADVA